MFMLDNVVVYSASDLATAARCEYALLRAFDDDDLLARTARLGDEHEQRHLDELRTEFGDNAVIIGRPAHTLERLIAAAEATKEVVNRRAPVIVQAAMFDGRFVGFADFLVLDDGGYRLRGVLDRRRSPRYFFPAQPQPGKRRDQPCEVRGLHRAVTAPD